MEPDPGTPLLLPILRWRRLILDVRQRSAGRRESGAFILGPESGPRRAAGHVCYDDLDPDAYQGGGIVFHAAGHAALWRHCREKKLLVLADVHTHPGAGVGQSPMDQQNPMLPIVGHIAIIIPNFAYTSCWSLETPGVHQYLGNFRWHTLNPAEKASRIRLTLW